MNSPFLSLFKATSSVSRTSGRTLWKSPFRSNPSIFDSVCVRCRRQQIRFNSGGRQLADDPRWVSVIDNPAKIVRTGRKHGGPGLILLGMIAFFFCSPFFSHPEHPNSFDTHYGVCAWNVAGAAIGLEDEIGCEI